MPASARIATQSSANILVLYGTSGLSLEPVPRWSVTIVVNRVEKASRTCDHHFDEFAWPAMSSSGGPEPSTE